MPDISIKREFTFLNNQLETLKQVPEIKYLSKNQVRLIKLSLYLSLRYNRYLAKNWQKHTRPKTTDPYFETADFFMTWFCHASVRAIEIEKFDEQLLIRTPSEYFHGDSTTQPISNSTQIKSLIIHKPAPKVVHLAKMMEGKLAPMHTVLYLGNHPNLGELFFEKEAAFEPFKITDTNTLVEYYPGFHWIFRNLTNSV